MFTMVFEPPLAPCRSYSFLYPNNGSLQPRRLLVTRVHDVHEGCLPQANWFVTGIDLDLQTEAVFLFDAMQEVQPIARMSIRIVERFQKVPA